MNSKKIIGGIVIVGLSAAALFGITGSAAAQTDCADVKFKRSDWGYSRAKVETQVFAQAQQLTVHGVTFWQSTWAGHLGTDKSMFDLDHHISLKEAHVLGGCNWTKSEKKAFANDVITGKSDTVANLFITTPGFNSSKGDRNPAEIAGMNDKAIAKTTLKDKATAERYCETRHDIFGVYSDLAIPETESACINYLVHGQATVPAK